MGKKYKLTKGEILTLVDLGSDAAEKALRLRRLAQSSNRSSADTQGDPDDMPESMKGKGPRRIGYRHVQKGPGSDRI